MYVSSGSACTHPNSQTPMSPRRIAAQNIRVARVGGKFVRGNVILNTLVQTLGGIGIGENVPGVIEAAPADFRNAPNCDTPILGNGSLYGGRGSNSNQGPGFDEGGELLPLPLGGNVYGSAPGAGGAIAAADPSAIAAAAAAAAVTTAGGPSSTAGAPAGTPGGLPWRWVPDQGARGGGRQRAQCLAPEVLAMMTVFPIPAPGQPMAVPISSISTPRPPSTAPAPKPRPSMTVPPAAKPPLTMPVFPTTGNLCLDVMLSYVDQSQITQNMIDACAQKGYAGVQNGPLLTSAMQAWRNANWANLPKVADQPNVPQYTAAMAKQYGFGLSGLGQVNGSAVALAIVGLAGAGLWWAMSQKKGTR